MILTKITSAVLALTFGVGLNLADIDLAAKEAAAQAKAASKYLDFEPADFTSYELTTFRGDKITVSVDGKDFCVDCDCSDDIILGLYDAENFELITKSDVHTEGTFSEDFTDDMEEDVLYMINVSYVLEGVIIDAYSNYVILYDGEIEFFKTPNYDYNLGSTEELWTDSESLLELTKPQNDVESDDPVVISYSNDIVGNAQDDWEKVFRIYTYITTQMVYDDVQIADDITCYQDGAKCLIRRQIAICEGFANVFVALCRAQGIPAAVEFGIGCSTYESLIDVDELDSTDSDHAWAAVCLDGEWYYLDPTFDIGGYYEGDSWDDGYIDEVTPGYAFYLLPLESFSFDHKILDADTMHGLEESGSCGNNATYEISRDGTLTIYGSGEIKLPEGCNGFTKVVFDPDSNITCIGEDCFIDCDLLTMVILPDTVTKIDDGAFYTCEDLEYVYIPEGVTYIGQEAFDFCDELAYIRVPDSCNEIGSWAFDDCGRLYLSIPSDLEGFNSGYYLDPMYIEVR